MTSPMDLYNVSIWPVHDDPITYRGVSVATMNGALNMFTVDSDGDDTVHVASYPLAALRKWVEREAPDAAPYVVPPEEDL